MHGAAQRQCIRSDNRIGVWMRRRGGAAAGRAEEPPRRDRARRTPPPADRGSDRAGRRVAWRRRTCAEGSRNTICGPRPPHTSRCKRKSGRAEGTSIASPPPAHRLPAAKPTSDQAYQRPSLPATTPSEVPQNRMLSASRCVVRAGGGGCMLPPTVPACSTAPPSAVASVGNKPGPEGDKLEYSSRR